MAATNPVFGWMQGIQYDCRIENDDAGDLSQELVNWSDMPIYANYTVYFVVVVIFLSILARLYYFVVDRRAVRDKRGQAPIDAAEFSTNAEITESRRSEPVARQNDFHPLRHLFALCRFVGYRRPPLWAQKLGASPSMAMNLTVVALFLYMCLWCFLPRFWYRACRYMGSPPLAVRAGLMATALVPFIYASVGKVNVLSGITGISYERLNFLHRSMGWIALFFSFVHTLPFLIQQGKEGTLHKDYLDPTDPIYINGTAWLVCWFLLCVLSLQSFRSAFYEAWLILHWPIGIASLGVAFVHCGNMLYSWYYLYAALAVLLSGYAYRYLMKTNYLNLLGGLWYTTDQALVHAIPGTDYVEITVFSRILRWWSPGQHVYLRFPSIEPFSNHPFSVATVSAGSQRAGHATLASKVDSDGETASNVRITGNSTTALMRFIVRRHRGFTQRLYNKAIAQTAENAPLSVMMDGPYGGLHRRLDAFDEVVLCASGNGSTGTLPFLFDVGSRIGQVTTAVRKVRVLWVVRHAADVQAFDAELAEAVQSAPAGAVDVQVFVVSSDKSSEHLQCAAHCNVHYGSRPQVPRILREWGPNYAPRTLFVCCGSPSFNGDVGNSVANLQSLVLTGKKNGAGEHYREFYLHSEMFGW